MFYAIPYGRYVVYTNDSRHYSGSSMQINICPIIYKIGKEAEIPMCYSTSFTRVGLVGQASVHSHNKDHRAIEVPHGSHRAVHCRLVFIHAAY